MASSCLAKQTTDWESHNFLVALAIKGTGIGIEAIQVQVKLHHYQLFSAYSHV